MERNKVESFVKLMGSQIPDSVNFADGKTRELGARILLSEVLEYIIDGLGIKLSVNGTEISDPEGIQYQATENIDSVAALDGIADVGYTMFWNAVRFGLPLEEAFERVADNNLEKFVKLTNDFPVGSLDKNYWDCGNSVVWPEEVVNVEAVKIGNEIFAVGKDIGGKVKKPSTYKSVILDDLVMCK